MNKKFNIYLFALIGLLGFTLTACDDDDDNGIAKAVMASVSNLNYEATGSPARMITVYSDATWTVETPDWITVEPSTGSGTTEVTVYVNDNLRDGTPDNPRKFDLVFKGVTKASEAHVMVRQDGDRYRDVAPITIADMNQLPDESTAIINNITVTSVLSGRFLATDGANQVLVNYDGEVNTGDVVNIQSYVSFDSQSMPVLIAEHLSAGAGVKTLPEAIDLTESVDSIPELAPRTMVKFSGKLDGKNITISDAAVNHPVILDAPAELALDQLNGHQVTLTGYYSGTASPAVNIYAQSVEDFGLIEKIYFSDDFEWLEDWAVAAGAGSTVETDNLDASAPALTSVKATIDGKEVTLFNYFSTLGYEIIYDKDDNKRTYLQRNYLKFGKTGNHSGIVLPSIADIPEGEATILSFDWCPMRQGSGKLDPVTLYVKVENGSDVKQFDIPTHGWENGHKLEWIRATVDLTGVKIDANTRITISQNEWEVSTANRWFLDNIKLVKK